MQVSQEKGISANETMNFVHKEFNLIKYLL